MKTRLRLQLLVFICLLLISGCTGTYIPTQQNVPLFTEKGEIEVTATITQTNNCVFNFSFNSCTPRHTEYVQIQSAYALTDHVAVLAGGSKAFGANNGYFAEAGTGYFTTLNILDKPIIGVSGVLGFGDGFPETKYIWQQFPGYTELKENRPHFIRAYIQPYAGYRKGHTEVAFSTRLTSFHNFYPIENEFFRNQSYLFAEPAITIRMGFKNIKIHGQIATTFKLNKEPLYYSQVNLNAGLSLRLPFKKEPKPADF